MEYLYWILGTIGYILCGYAAVGVKVKYFDDDDNFLHENFAFERVMFMVIWPLMTFTVLIVIILMPVFNLIGTVDSKILMFITKGSQK